MLMEINDGKDDFSSGGLGKKKSEKEGGFLQGFKAGFLNK